MLGDEARGDVGAHGFWKRGRTTIFDVQICDTDAKSYGNRTSKKVLESAALRKKSKYEEACLERRRDFTPMIYFRSNTLLLRGDRAMNWRRRAPDDGVAARAALTIRVQ